MAKDARNRILNAALTVIRQKGYAATSVDDLCEAAGVSKGAFFHHFKGKEALAIAAAGHWSEVTGARFAEAPYHDHDDPLDRILGYVDFRASLIQGDVAGFTCLVGTMVQESHETSPAIRAACNESITGHARTLEQDFQTLLERHGKGSGLTAQSLALHTQAVTQGAFVLTKAGNDPSIAREMISHLRRYLELLFIPNGGDS